MIRLGIIGAGGMAHHQASLFIKISDCKLVACCDTEPERAQMMAQTHNIPGIYPGHLEMLDGEELDAVSVVTDDRNHCQPCLAAIRQGLPVLCEKPLADNLADARQMATEARRHKAITAVNFSSRDSAATQKAASLVAAGKLGRILHVEGSYLQSWLSSDPDWREKTALLWRLSREHGSLGCLGDIGAHLYDLATFIAGDIHEVMCDLKTFDKGVKRVDNYKLDANDSFVTQVRFKNGAIGTLHGSRWATGNINSISLRVWGDKGALDLNLDHPPARQLLGCVGTKNVREAKWEAIKCPAKPDNYQRFIAAVRTGQQCQTSFEVALRVQAYLDYSLRSASERKYLRVR